MVDLAWRKLIIKVECAKNSENEKRTAPDADALGSTVYICRSCPSFRTLVKETVGSHLSEVHHIEVKLNPEIVSEDLDTSPVALSHHRSPPLSPTVPASLTSPVSSSGGGVSGGGGGGEGNWSCSSPLPHPHSPVSPLTKDSCQPRKKITVTLNASPTLSLSTITPTVTTESTTADGQSPREVNQPEMNSLGILAYHDQCGSSVDTSSSTVRSTSSSPEFHPKPSTQILYECQFCGQRFVRRKSFEKHKIRQHSDVSLGSLQQGTTPSAANPSRGVRTKSTHPATVQQVPCQECDRIFSSKQARDLHARVHRVAKSKYKCALCSSIFRNLGSLKRHAVSAHSIVPESVFTDNPKDKDFDVSGELSDLDSDSCSSSSSSGVRCAGKSHRGRKRRLGFTNHSQQLRKNTPTVLIRTAVTTAAAVTTTATITAVPTAVTAANASDNPPRRRRGRPRRSQTRIIRPLDNHLDLTALDPLRIASQLEDSRFADGRGETRYRTILPRPPGGTGGADGAGSDSAKFFPPIAVDRSHRKRPKRCSRKLMHKPSTLVPLLLADSSSMSFGRNRMSVTTQATQPNMHTVYLDQYAMAPTTTYVTLDPTTYQNAYSLDLVAADESGQLVSKPPHVLTVAAAYASQLPIGSIPTAVTAATDETESLVKTDLTSTDCQSGDGNTSAISALPIQPASIIPGIQIYPSPWVDGQMQTVVPSAVTSTSLSESGPTDLQPSSPTSSADPTHCPTSQMSIPVAQPLQLYPVLGPDGVTTMYYYMTTPVELLHPSTTGAQISSTGELNPNLSESGSTDVSTAPTATTSYYCTYANPMQWVTHTTESGELAVVSVASSGCCPSNTAYDSAAAGTANDTFELDDLFEQDSVTQRDPGSDVFDSESSRAVQHVSLDCADQSIDDCENIEVIELDAAQFESQLKSEIDHSVLCAAHGNDTEQDGDAYADSVSDNTMVPTEVVDLGVARELPCLDDPEPETVKSSGEYAAGTVEGSAEAYAIETVTETEHPPSALCSTETTTDLTLAGNSLTESPQEPSSDASEKLSTIVPAPVPLVQHTVHANIPTLTHLLSQASSCCSSASSSHFNRTLSRDDLHTPLIENRDAFDFSNISSDHDTTGYSPVVERNSNVCS